MAVIGQSGGRGATDEPPLVVMRGPRARFVAIRERLRDAGWLVREDWDLDEFDDKRAVVCAGVVSGRADAVAVVLAAVDGAGVLVHAQADDVLVADLLEDLGELGSVDYRDMAEIRHLSDEQRRLLALLGEGLTLAQAGARLNLSRRTAARRLADAKRVLHASSTYEAIRIAEEGAPD